MPSAYTTRNRLVKQAPGEGTNVWGAILNSGVFDLVDFAADGITTISASGATTLTSANGSADQARARMLNITASGAWAITVPAVEKFYIVRGVSAAGTITCGGASASVAAGDTAIVICNGSDCFKAQSNDFAGARIKNVGTATAGTDAVNYNLLIATAFATQAGDYPGLTGNKRRHLTVNDAETAPGWDWAHLIPFERKTLGFTAVQGSRYLCDTTSAAFTATLPASPAEGDRVGFADGGSTDTFPGFGQNNLTIARNGSTIHGLAQDVTVSTRGAAMTAEYINSTWRLSVGC